MSQENFSVALRAELDAVVARYEALVRAHQEALSAPREAETLKLRGDLTSLLADRERVRKSESDLRDQLRASAERIERLERELGTSRHQLEVQRREAEEARQKAEKQLEVMQAETAKQRAQAQADAEARLQQHRREVGELTSRLARAEADARTRIEQLTAERTRAEQRADSLDSTFSAERAFVAACAPLAGTAMHEALRSALGSELNDAPATYAAIKARRPDAVLTSAFKERGRTIVTAPLTSRERDALPGLAGAAGCELIVPERGARFAGAAMEKASTQVDPAEEGNVLDCLLPGLRLSGTDGTMVAPRVVVATG